MAIEPIHIQELESYRIGHASNIEAGTGCTVILCDQGAITGVDVRGGAPGTRETDLLNPINLVDRVHGILMTGGSAFGLDAAAGVMEYLESKDIGFDVQVTFVPIVTGAALFDLPFGRHDIRPDKAMGIEACLASEHPDYSMGNIGAGTGATVGKILGPEKAMKGGLGWAAFRNGSLKVAAIAAVNCLGNVINPDTLETLAGPLFNGNTIGNTEDIILEQFQDEKNLFSGNTTLCTVITNGDFTKSQCTKLAGMSQNGLARTLRPAHTMFDGDTVFYMASGALKADQNMAGILSAHAVQHAVINAITSADSLHGIKGFKDNQK